MLYNLIVKTNVIELMDECFRNIERACEGREDLKSYLEDMRTYINILDIVRYEEETERIIKKT